jgi:hypothetical protein
MNKYEGSFAALDLVRHSTIVLDGSCSEILSNWLKDIGFKRWTKIRCH